MLSAKRPPTCYPPIRQREPGPATSIVFMFASLATPIYSHIIFGFLPSRARRRACASSVAYRAPREPGSSVGIHIYVQLHLHVHRVRGAPLRAHQFCRALCDAAGTGSHLGEPARGSIWRGREGSVASLPTRARSTTNRSLRRGFPDARRWTSST